MRRVLVALIVLFSVRVEGACPRPGSIVFNDVPKCQVVYKVPSSGEFAYQESYCKGDYPYCDQMSGDCCSEASYNEGLGGCCDSSTYVAHKVEDVSIKALNMFANNYKCCARGSYGNNSTYYFDAEGHAQCCGGEVYEAKSGSGKTCCNNEYNADGTVKRYYSTATVDGSPVGEVEKTCCVTKGDAPAGYKQTAYWNGGAQCCDGKTYKTGTDDTGTATYGCCVGSKGSNKTHKVVSTDNAPNGEQGCCARGEDGSVPKGYWNGSSVGCCYNGKVVSVLDAPNNQEACCDTETYGANPTAYWNGGSAICCKGEAAKKDDGTYVCCPIEECSDGQELVTNYVDGIGACGEICCTKKEGYTEYSPEGCSLSDDSCTKTTYSDYQAVGGVNGSCCGGEYGGVEKSFKVGDDLDTSSSIKTYKVRDNNGYYCALDTSGSSTADYSDKKVHLSDSECGSYLLTKMVNSSQIFTSPDGDPCSNGASKVWECSYWFSDDGFGTCPLPEEAYEDAMNSYENGS